MTLNYTGRVNAGVLKVINRKQFDKDLLIFEGKEVELIVKKKKKVRSLSQNAYYHGALIPIIREALYDSGIHIDRNGVHELLKLKCNQIECINKKTGEVTTLLGSTTQLSTSEFMDYIVRIKNWAREFLNIELPEPGEPLHFKFENTIIE